MVAIAGEEGLHVSTRIPFMGGQLRQTMKEMKVFHCWVQGLQLLLS